MNRFGIFLCLMTTLVISLDTVYGQATCQPDVLPFFKGIDFIDFRDGCHKATEEQIKMGVTAAMKYLSMGAFFSRDSVNRPGFAKIFFDGASEKREFASKLIEYLVIRNRYFADKEGRSQYFKPNLADLVKSADKPKIFEGKDLKDLEDNNNGLTALQIALKIEVAVTKSIRKLIEACENDDKFNDYHFVKYLTGEFLGEQYSGQRDLAGKISTLGKIVQGNGAALGEFLFDKQLL